VSQKIALRNFAITLSTQILTDLHFLQMLFTVVETVELYVVVWRQFPIDDCFGGGYHLAYQFYSGVPGRMHAPLCGDCGSPAEIDFASFLLKILTARGNNFHDFSENMGV